MTSLLVAVFADAARYVPTSGGIRGHIMACPYIVNRYAITPHGKGLGVGASVRTLPGAVKERMFERSEFLAPAANGFVRIAPKTPALDFSFVTFLCIKTKEK